jgi:hypothetical protein
MSTYHTQPTPEMLYISNILRTMEDVQHHVAIINYDHEFDKKN